LRVTAILDDLPATTHLNVQIVISGRAAFSPLTLLDSQPPGTGIRSESYTYFRLAPGASIEQIRRRAGALMQQHSNTLEGNVSLAMVPIAEMHLRPAGMFPMKPSGDLGAIRTAAVIGILIVLVACINFVNLMTARAAERAVEVGIRKASGAGRHDLVRQFIGESLLYVALGMLLALAAVELILPEFNSLLERSADTAGAPGLLDYFHAPARAVAVIAALLATGVLAGSYPAFVLSTFRPALVLKSMPARVAGSVAVRQVLVILQFAILIGLILATTVIYRQTLYAMRDGQRIDTDQVLLVYVDPGEDNEAFKDSVRSLGAVRGLTSSAWLPTNIGALQWRARFPDGTIKELSFAPVDFGFFEFYGLRPLAGRLFSRQHGTDAVPAGNAPTAQLSVVINATAMHTLNRWLHGFAYHVDLEPWMFAAAGAAALVIAVFTVGTHCLVVSHGRPVSALRYE
jgi:putative ABC transport system permease protein